MHPGPHHPGGAGELLGRGVRAVLERARVGGQQRQPVGEHVMHLAGDPRPLRHAGLGDAAGLFGLGAAGPLAQRGEQRLPGTVPLAPADERRPGGDHEDRPPPVRQRPVRPPQAADQVRHDVRAAGRHGDRQRAALRDVQRPQRRGRRGRGRQRRQHGQRHRAGHRPAQQHRHQGAGHEPHRDIQDQQPGRLVRAGLPQDRRRGQRPDPCRRSRDHRQRWRFTHASRLGPAWPAATPTKVGHGAGPVEAGAGERPMPGLPAPGEAAVMTTTTSVPETLSPGTYRIDEERCLITFRTRHLFGLGPVRGTFRLRSGEIRVAEQVQDSAVRATVDAESFHTGNPGQGPHRPVGPAARHRRAPRLHVHVHPGRRVRRTVGRARPAGRARR